MLWKYANTLRQKQNTPIHTHRNYALHLRVSSSTKQNLIHLDNERKKTVHRKQ